MNNCKNQTGPQTPFQKKTSQDKMKVLRSLLTGSKIVLAHWLLILIQLVLVIVLLVYGVNGKQELDKSEEGTGVPYYIGAIIAASIFAALAISTGVLLLLYKLDVDTGSGAMYCIVCLLTYLGLPGFLIGMVFTVVFGMVDCKRDDGTTYDHAGSCSYSTNIDSNYHIATVCLVLIILLFITNFVGIFLLCKHGDPMDTSAFDGGPGATSGGSSGGGNPTLKKMVKDRERRADYLRQLRMGIPHHKIVPKPRF